ncbi:5 -AMP-activated kinase subunit beta-2 [Fusarium agapanthi]|uniref:5 -AMP-activated kinase subunit beta-2 n=1 Tax=Fusarium agapanthi TaxID=1803897 RepID=A0A9P5EIG6_9HYPO|nr:5 -AMP-activated kinase subunit beta-2 [Fusarium agapanthi]
MGSFTFKWEHTADEVYVTGTFDNWTKSVQLEKEGNVFSKTVDLKEPEGKIYYKHEFCTLRQHWRQTLAVLESFTDGEENYWQQQPDYLARLLLRIARTRWTNSCYDRAAQESVLLRPSLSQSAGLFKPKELGGA